MNRDAVAWGVVAVGLLLLWAYATTGEAEAAPVDAEPADDEGDDDMPTPMLYSAKKLTKAQRIMADLIVEHATDAGLNPSFMLALAVTESSLRPTIIGDDGRSTGLFQLLLPTAKRYDPPVEQDDLLDPATNARIGMKAMAGMMEEFPGHNYGDYAEAWTLGGTGKFVKKRKNPAKLTAMARAIADLGLTLNLNEVP